MRLLQAPEQAWGRRPLGLLLLLRLYLPLLLLLPPYCDPRRPLPEQQLPQLIVPPLHPRRPLPPLLLLPKQQLPQLMIPPLHPPPLLLLTPPPLLPQLRRPRPGQALCWRRNSNRPPR